MIRPRGTSEKLVITSQRDLIVNMGDTIRCLAGGGVAMMNPGTGAGAYILGTKVPNAADPKYVTSLVINEKMFRNIPRGEISSLPDIGTQMTATGATTR